jgi:hypothetical protein
MLALYCDVEAVVRPGDQISVHVSTTSSTFRLELYPAVGGSTPAWRSEAFPGALLPAGDPTRDWNWPGYLMDVPTDLPGGVYLVVGVELGNTVGADPSLIGYDGTALLAVTATRPTSTALYKLPMRTYQAYNPAGGASLYVNGVWREGSCVVTLRRPGAGTGGPTAEPVDIYAPGQPRQTFWRWDAPFLSWAARTGYQLDVVFDTALDGEPALLDAYRALVTAGHDEYWTPACYELTHRFVEAGGGLAVFGANTCWWRAEVVDTELRVAKDRHNPSGGDLWWRIGGLDSALLGLSYRHGGGSWLAARPESRYQFRPDGDPLLYGVDLETLTRLSTLAGYEVDGHAFRPNQPWQALNGDGTPADLVVLAYAPLVDQPPAAWAREPREEGLDSPRCAAMAYRRPAGSLVFSAGTTDWPCHLDNPAVDRLTRNVLDAVRVTNVRAADGAASRP